MYNMQYRGTVVQDALNDPCLNFIAIKVRDVTESVDFEDRCGFPKDNLVANGEICGTGYIHQVSIALTLECGDPKAGDMYGCLACVEELPHFFHPTPYK